MKICCAITFRKSRKFKLSKTFDHLDGPVLILDASGAVGFVSLICGDKLFERRNTARMGQAGKLTEAITEVLQEADLKAKDITKIIAGVGPGSFTGIRICLATALGLIAGIAQAQKPKLYCVDSFDVQYAAFRRLDKSSATNNVLVLVDSKRTDIFAQSYDSEGMKTGKPFLVQASELAGHIIGVATGDGLPADQLVENLGTKKVDLLTADYIEANRSNESRGILIEPKPFYLRQPDVGKPKNP